MCSCGSGKWCCVIATKPPHPGAAGMQFSCPPPMSAIATDSALVNRSLPSTAAKSSRGIKAPPQAKGRRLVRVDTVQHIPPLSLPQRHHSVTQSPDSRVLGVWQKVTKSFASMLLGSKTSRGCLPSTLKGSVNLKAGRPLWSAPWLPPMQVTKDLWKPPSGGAKVPCTRSFKGKASL